MTVSDYEPDIIIYPFHRRLPGMDNLYHTRCSKHPSFTLCGSLVPIEAAVEEHLKKHVQEDTS